MTVIALLNVENDPHVVADTMLSAEGEDTRVNKTVWLPSLGQVQSTFGSEGNPWHIVRLARKTFFLPNHGGVLAFAGDCKAAFGFWKELSANIMTIAGYQPGLDIDREMIERAIGRSDGTSFNLLGVIKNAKGQWEVFTHNKHQVFVTETFGTCYLAGSGSELLRAKILQRDLANQYNRSQVKYRIGPTENLAEGLSSDLLYAESDSNNGLSDATSYGCGGFYEWYRVVEGGVKMSSPRLDIHISESNGKPVITRLYLVEALKQKESRIEPIPVTMYSVMVMSLILDPSVPLENSFGSWSLSAPDPHSVLIQPTFKLYSDKQTDGRLSGPVSNEVLDEFFGQPVAIKRIRLTCSVNGIAIARSLSRLPGEREVLATLAYENDRLEVSLSSNVVEVAKKILSRET
ncbi:hypothetical protein [Rhodoferax mekongensis]|uniref:Uncharacterized protein n=1 Tax=Rhodoferax mekongensis TaxID=3068341 RepID=A0ABZ0AXF6_9BURK|nr:hypothetical protein [Rhodoferax sp. TBRC 17307]WNO03995.1 hypothetical protein RAN89_13895 [Rhodoferax sp. TBRC 17307]